MFESCRAHVALRASRARFHGGNPVSPVGPSSGSTSAAAPAKPAPLLKPLSGVPLYLTEQDVQALLSPSDAVDAVERCFERMARGVVEIAPRRRLPLDEGQLAD